MPSYVDAYGRMCSLLTDLLKACICIDHELFIANLYVNGFNKHSLLFHTLILNIRKEINKINSSDRVSAKILLGVHHILYSDQVILTFVYQTFIQPLLNFRKTLKRFLNGFEKKFTPQTALPKMKTLYDPHQY